MSAVVAASTVATASIAAIGATAGRGVTARAAVAVMATTPWPRSKHHAIFRIRRPPALLPPPQDLPVHGRQRAQDRLQGRQAVAALHLGARQDRPEPHHRGLEQEAA